MGELNLAVVGVVNNQGNILVGKKRNYQKDDPLSEKWHIPGGKVELGEHPEEAIEREIFEETGISVEVSRVLDVRSVKKLENNPQKFILVIWYECTPINTNIQESKELSAVKWVPKNQVFDTVDQEAINLFPELVHNYLKEK